MYEKLFAGNKNQFCQSSLEEQRKSYINLNISILTRITDQKIQCVYVNVYQRIKNWGPGPYNSLCHADNRKYFLGLSHVKSKGSANVFLGKGRGKISDMFLLRKGNFIMINEDHFTVPLIKELFLFFTQFPNLISWHNIYCIIRRCLYSLFILLLFFLYQFPRDRT